ncbi:CHAT domain-containing protein [Streptomyces uncialis]|uniref:CHAT domain-containing protein n=1 Tax=Streptomyces uncialis TaxID=1048205 RepID=UPI0037B86EA2
MERRERDHRLRVVHERLLRLQESGDPGGPDGLFGPAADEETGALLRASDLTTDLEVRWAVGWLYWFRCGALGEGRGTREGSSAGTLLFPVWAVDPRAVPEELAAGFARIPSDQRPDPAAADGPAEWHVVCESAVAAAGDLSAREAADDPASSYLSGLNELAERIRSTSGIDLAQLLWTGVASGTLAVLATRRDDPVYPARLGALASALGTLSRVDGTTEPLDEAVAVGRRAVKVSRTDDPQRAVRLSNHGLTLIQRYEATSDPEDLYEATGIARDVLDGAGPGHPEYGRYASSLAHALSLCAERDGGTPGLHDEAVDLMRRAVPGDPNGRGSALLNLGIALFRGYRRTDRTADLEEAVAVLTRARTEPGTTPELRSHADEVLATVLRARHARTGHPADPDAAGPRTDPGTGVRTDTGPDGDRDRDMVQAAGAGDGAEPAPRAAMRLVNSAQELRARHERGTGGPEALKEAVARLRKAVALLPDDHVRRPTALHELGSVLSVAHQTGTGPYGLDEAVGALREAVRRTPDGHGELGARLMTLGGALGLRYRVSNDSGDLRESLEHRRRAAALPGLPVEQRAAILVSSGSALLDAAERTGDPALAAQAVQQIRAGAELTPGTDPKLPARRTNLALALLTDFQLTGSRARVREARELMDAVLAALPEGNPRRANALMTAATVRLAGERTGWWSAARREAVGLMRQAVRVTPQGHSRRAARLATLGSALLLLHERTRAATDLAEAVDALRAGALDPSGAPSTRLDAARNWGRACLALGRPDQALEAFTMAVDLLPAVSPRHLVRDEQEFGLGQAVGLGAEAAACAVRHGDPSLAVRLLEQARGILLSQAFDADSDLTELAARAPELAARFVRLREHVDALTDESRMDGSQADGSQADGEPARPGPGTEPHGEPSGPGRGTEPHGTAAEPHVIAPERRPTTAEPHDPAARPRSVAEPHGTAAERRGRAATEWDELISRIRTEHPGLRLFRPVREWDEAELRATAAEGPVVLLYVPPPPELPGTDSRAPAGGALIVTAGGVDSLPLPGLTARDAGTLTARFQEALGLLAAPDCPRTRALEAQAVVRDTLDWLWTAVTGPVLGHLGLTAGPPPGQEPPRIWWSPGGPLGALPLHAAAPDGTGSGALDLVVSSYTPTVRALRHARAREQGRPAVAGRPLIVSVPEAEGLPPLPGARGEARLLAGLLADVTVLDGAAATKAAVQRHLTDHPYAHFACHAVSDPLRPSLTRLALHGPAAASPTVRDLARLRLPDARLAYLSACDTLRTSPELADESVHVVSAFQMAGFPHVVGSLWSVDDTVAARTAHAVYERLTAAGGPPAVSGTARALHHAVRALRADYPLTPSLWACQVHAGP